MVGISLDLMISRCYEPTLQSHNSRAPLLVEYVMHAVLTWTRVLLLKSRVYSSESGRASVRHRKTIFPDYTKRVIALVIIVIKISLRTIINNVHTYSTNLQTHFSRTRSSSRISQTLSLYRELRITLRTTISSLARNICFTFQISIQTRHLSPETFAEGCGRIEQATRFLDFRGLCSVLRRISILRRELLSWGGGSRVSVRGPRGRRFGRATIEGDKCARQGPRRGLLLPRAAARGNLLLAFASEPRRGMRESTRRGYLHLETGYEHARAF